MISEPEVDVRTTKHIAELINSPEFIIQVFLEDIAVPVAGATSVSSTIKTPK
jgi:hypothetical protein